MTIHEVKCDCCGKVLDTSKSHPLFPDLFTSAYLCADGKLKHFDFCNEDCLRDFLVEREEGRPKIQFNTSLFPRNVSDTSLLERLLLSAMDCPTTFDHLAGKNNRIEKRELFRWQSLGFPRLPEIEFENRHFFEWFPEFQKFIDTCEANEQFENMLDDAFKRSSKVEK